ncbi:hypothetical protein OAE77_00880, partial [bacterium]|nr:hypothetical protein [bacterium]
MKVVPACRWGLPFLICCVVSLDSLRSDEAASRFDALVLQLDHPRFHQRLSASEKLLLAGLGRSGNINPEVTSALTRGAQHQSLELRVAVQRLIEELALRYQQQQLDLLVNVQVPTQDIDLPGWQDFARTVGSDRVSRHFFQQLVDRHSDTLHASFVENVDGPKTVTSIYDPWKLPSRNDL